MDYHHLRRRRKSAALPRMLLAGLIVLVIGGASVIFYEYKTHPEWRENMNNYRERIGTWLAERKKNMHHGVGRVRSEPEEQEDGDQPVNFEFYSTLQEMKSMQADAHAAAEQKRTENNAMTVNKRAVKSNHAADLEKDLLAAIQQASGGK